MFRLPINFKTRKKFQKILLSGSPATNNGRSLENIINFINGQKKIELKSLTYYDNFIKTNSKIILSEIMQYSQVDYNMIKSLPNIMYTDPPTLPNKHEFLVLFELSINQQNILRSNQPKGIMTDHCNFPTLLEIGYRSSKLLFVYELIEGCVKNHEKVIICSDSLKTLEYYMLKCKTQKKILDNHTFMLNGSSSSNQRGMAQDNFNNALGFAILFGTTEVFSTGLNFQSCRRIIMVYPPWENEVITQSIARCHRVGQKQEVFFYLLMYNNKTEEKVFRSCMRKELVSNLLLCNNTTKKGDFTYIEYCQKQEANVFPPDPIFNVNYFLSQSNNMKFLDIQKM